jgi:hypothetical protein
MPHILFTLKYPIQTWQETVVGSDGSDTNAVINFDL